MITYKNISFSAKTFYGVKFESGEIKSVPGFINDSGMVRIFEKKPKAAKPMLFEESDKFETRGRKKKSIESEKVSVAETSEVKINTSEEETSNGNPS